MKETTRKIGLGNRGVLTVITVVGIAVLLIFAMRNREGFYFTSAVQKQTAAFGGWTYDQEDQRKAASALASAGLTDYEWDEDRLMVPASRRGEYERILSENQALPQKPSDLKQEALDGISAFESESRIKMRDLYSSARQLEKMLESFEQIESASVGPHARREDSGFRQRLVVTATISVKPKRNQPLTPELVSSITMAARHLLGITSNDDVSVIDTVSGHSWLGSEGSVSRISGNSYSQEKERLERLWTEKFHDVFDYIAGIRVAVSVELTPVLSRAGKETEEQNQDSEFIGVGVSERRKMGLQFEDEDLRRSKAADSDLHFQPKSIAVSITLPESYIWRLCGVTDRSFQGEESDLFYQKKEELLTQLRETASALLVPAVEEGENFQKSLDVSSYADLPDETEEYALYPQGGEGEVSAAEESENIHLSEKTSSENSLKSILSMTAVKEIFNKSWSGYLFAAIAFFTGIGVRSLIKPRKSGTPSQKKSAEDVSSSEKVCAEDKAETAEVLSVLTKPEQKEQMNTSDTLKASKTVSEPAAASFREDERSEQISRKAAREEELKRIFDDLDTQDEELKEDFSDTIDLNIDEEMISPSLGSDTKNPERLFTAVGKDERQKNYRIDEGTDQMTGPHFSHTDFIDEDEEVPAAAGEESSFPYVFKQGKLRVPESPADEVKYFSFLESLSVEELRALIAKQRPQTIALIVRSASESVGSQVLNFLGARLRSEVERRIKASGTPEPQIVAAVETSLRNELGISAV